MRAGAALAAWVILVGLGLSLSEAAAALAAAGGNPLDTPPAFNALNRGINGGDVYKRADNRTGQLAWGEAYALEAYLVMYEATGDTAYLDILIDHADAVLAGRDSERGWTDYRGLSLPGWQAAGHYSIGEAVLRDAHGREALYLRVASTGNNHATRAHVAPVAGRAGFFDLRIENPENRYDHTFQGLSMDPADERYAVSALLASTLADPWGSVRLYAEDRRPEPARDGTPLAEGSFAFTPPPYLWPVHQGRITFPLISFARLVYEDPALQAVARYKERADAYIAATRAALELLEENWRENDEGEGWYVIPRGAPVWMDGVEEPHNHSLAVGRSIIQLAAVTGDPKWRDRAERLARTLHGDLRLLPGGGYTWPYWWSKGYAYRGWSPEDGVSLHTPALRPRPTASDVSHAAIDVEFAFLAFQNGIVFTEEDMERFARTVTENMLVLRPEGTPALTQYVDGSGAPSYYDDSVAARYLVLADWAPELVEAVERIYAAKGVRAYVGDLLGVARLNWARARREAGMGQDAPRISVRSPAPDLRETTRVRGLLPVELDVWAAPDRKIAGVTVAVNGRTIYDAGQAPAAGALVLDTFALSDGLHTLSVEAWDDRGALRRHRVLFTVHNRWERATELEPPVQTMFGLVDRTLIRERSPGWRHVAAGEEPRVPDRSRMVYEGTGPGFLVWQSLSPPDSAGEPEIEWFSFDLYAPYALASALERVIAVSVSADGGAWADVPYEIRLREDFGSWRRLEVAGTVPGGLSGRLLRFAVTPGGGDFALQLGAVRFGGLWR